MSKKLKKVFFLQGALRHYRYPLVVALSGRCILTLGQPLDSEFSNSGGVVSIKKFRFIQIFGFEWVKGLSRYIKQKDFDAYVLPFDIHWLNVILCTFLIPRQKLFWFGIGLGKSPLANRIKYSLGRRNNLILYSERDVSGFVAAGVPIDQISIAHNTVEVMNPVTPAEKRSKYFLFVGSLDPRKGLKELIDIFDKLRALAELECPKLIVVGDGLERLKLQSYVDAKELQDVVTFKGQITDSAALRDIYVDAIACLSFSQAGLSVLQSLGNSTPFITCYDAISGGEILNIEHGVTGFLMTRDLEDWVVLVRDLITDSDLTKRLNERCYIFYQENRTIARMVDGFRL